MYKQDNLWTQFSKLKPQPDMSVSGHTIIVTVAAPKNPRALRIRLPGLRLGARASGVVFKDAGFEAMDFNIRAPD